MCSVLSERLREGGLVVVESFSLAGHKTKDFVAVLDQLGLDRPTLIVDSLDNHNLALSSRNLRNVKFVSPDAVNVYEVLTHERLAITRDAASELDKRLSR